jgi:hypothetical protein
MITIPLSSSSRCLFLEQHLKQLRVNSLTIINLVHNLHNIKKEQVVILWVLLYLYRMELWKGWIELMGQTQALALLSHTFSA